ncbi:MAG: hypothetical protein HFE63_07385 [Clostridiales bacterium]|nr:hypothetical protein [Clostridiales bacterium]
MKKSLRIQYLLICGLLLSSFAACGSEPSDPDTSDSNDLSTSAQDSIDTAATQYPELEVRDLNGQKVNVLVRTEWNYEFMVDEQTGDTVSDAIFNRNRAIEERYNCSLNFIDFAGAWGSHTNFTNIIHNSVLASDGEYDFIAGYQAVLTSNIANGDLMNLHDVPYLTLDAPWWTQEGIDALTFNGRCYEVGGDIAVSLLEGINCMFYNKKLAEDFGVPDLYQLVEDGKWTHDKMLEVSKGVYQDMNSNDIKDIEDRFGFVSPSGWIRTYVVAYDTPTIDVGGKLIWNNSHTVSVVEKLVDCFQQPDVIYTANTNDADKIFSESRALLMNTTLKSASKLREMNDDFGIIPMPKFDEKQDSYYTTTSNEVSMICVPITAPDMDVSGLMIEAMCRESTDTVASSFYDVALSGKYVRDDKSLEMLELIRGSLTFDFGWISSMATGVSGAQYETMVKENNSAFASWYAANESSIQERTNTYLEAYKN